MTVLFFANTISASIHVNFMRMLVNVLFRNVHLQKRPKKIITAFTGGILKSRSFWNSFFYFFFEFFDKFFDKIIFNNFFYQVFYGFVFKTLQVFIVFFNDFFSQNFWILKYQICNLFSVLIFPLFLTKFSRSSLFFILSKNKHLWLEEQQ